MLKGLWTLSVLAVLAATVARGADEEIENVMPPPALIVVEPGFRTTTPDGSRPRAGLYSEPYTGYFLNVYDVDLRYGKDAFDFIDGYLSNFGAHTWSGNVGLWLQPMPGMIKGWWDRSTFYPDPLAVTPLRGSRSSQRYEGTLWPFPRTLFRGGYSKEVIKEPGLTRFASGVGYGAEEISGTIGVPLGPGSLTLDVSALDYQDYIPGTISSVNTQYGLGYEAAVTSRWLVGAHGRWTSIRQPGQRPTDLFILGVDTLYQMGDNLWVRGGWKLRDINLGLTQNGYVAKSSGGNASLSWRPAKSVTLRAGYEQNDLERINAAQTGVDHPVEKRVWARADFREVHGWRTSAKFDRRTLAGLDPNATPGARYTNSLFVNLDQKLDIRTSRPVGQGGLAYGFWQYRQKYNRATAVDHSFGSLGAGALYPLSDQLSVTADLLYNYLSSSAPGSFGLATDAFVLHLGSAYQWSAWNFSADYYWANSDDGANADTNDFQLGVAWNVGGGNQLRLSYHRDDYSNATFPGLRYDTDVVDIAFRGAF